MRYNGQVWSPRSTARMSWPSATMTWGERRRLHDGDVYHRDCSTPIDIERALGDCLYSIPLDGRINRSRQDAPAGDGKLIMHSPQGLATLTARNFPSPRALGLESTTGTAITARWEPMRAQTALPASRASGLAAPRLEEPWRHHLHSMFPTVTRGNPQLAGKQNLQKKRAAARWQDRLSDDEQSRRGATPR